MAVSRAIAAGLLGLSILAAWLIAWHVVSDAAGFFAPATLLFGLLCLLLGQHATMRRAPLLARALRCAGWCAVALGVAASLSLGAFLPTRLAEWISPALGRFGGPLALLLVALALLYSGVIRRYRSPDGRALDLATFAFVLAIWLQVQIGRQVTFPPPPTIATFLAPRLTFLFWVASLLALGALVTRFRPGERSPWTLAAVPYRRWLWRWGVLATVFGLLLSFVFSVDVWTRFVIPLVLLLAASQISGVRLADFPTHLRGGSRKLGWLVLVLLALALAYAATSEDVEAVFARNTVERRTLVFWEDVLGDQRTVSTATGSLAGVVRDTNNRPVAGASFVVADIIGRTYTTTSGADGGYRIASLPAGNYLPLAVAPAHLQRGRVGPTGRVATVRAGRDASGVDFRLPARPAYDVAINDSLRLGEQTEITIEGLESDTVLRRDFTFANRGKLLDGGIVHEPLPTAGAGPFPILLIIYPGEAASWEGVSVPLAARGYVVVSYFPRRLLDLDGDLDDLRLLLNLAADGKLSARGDGSRIVLVGGSVSTIYTYQLAQTFSAQPFAANIPATIQYGGLFDLFAFRQSWETGGVIIDPGISELEYLLVALGRPDTRPELYLRLSPRYDLGPDRLPPTLLVHAERDIIVPVAQSKLAAAGLSAAGVAHELLLYPELEHYLDISKRDPAQLDMLERTLAFLQTWTDPRRQRP